MEDYGYHKFIKVEQKGKVLVVTLNNPEARNALFADQNKYLENIWATVRSDPEVGAVVLTGTGKAFSGGGNIKMFAARTGGSSVDAEGDRLIELSKSARQRSGGMPLYRAVLTVPQPIIAAVNGDALGAGLMLALFCDIIIAAEGARLGDTHVRLGLVPGDGGCALLPLMVGLHKAKELVMTGDLVNGREAERIGLVNKCVPLDELMPTAMELANRLADGAPLAVMAAKWLTNKHLLQALNLTDAGVPLENITFLSDDHKEAAQAFVEKRKPTFTGEYPTRQSL